MRCRDNTDTFFNVTCHYREAFIYTQVIEIGSDQHMGRDTSQTGITSVEI